MRGEINEGGHTGFGCASSASAVMAVLDTAIHAFPFAPVLGGTA